MKKTMIGGALRRSAAALACLAAGALPATAANPAAAANESLALKPGNEYLMVANYPNNLNVVDLASERVYKTCALPDAFGPGITQIAPDRRTAYILNNRFGTMFTSRASERRQVATKLQQEVTRLGGRIGSTQMRLVNDEGTLIATGAAAYVVA